MIVASLRNLQAGVRKPFSQFFGSGRSLATYNIEAAFPSFSPVLVQVAFALLCTVSGISLRWVLDFLWSGAGPFALMVPFVLLATLFGKWQSGLLTAVLSSLYAWYYVLPLNGSLAFEDPSDGPRVIVNILAAFFVVALAELFRRTMWQALADREMLLREIEHRVQNNFASVASLLRFQMREHAEDETIMYALQAALGRVESYATVNSFLYRGDRYTGTVHLPAYLAELCGNLEKSAPVDKGVSIRTEIADFTWERDSTIVVGLLINELVTNAYKHAFTGRPSGVIQVSMQGTNKAWMLEVSDDGVGFTGLTERGSLGVKLISTLASQLGAQVEVSSDENGTRYIIGTRSEPMVAEGATARPS
ncbi:histidine kinase dimerization/phosphoacceptor domain -containing protein [uncultured Roseibium sp.]|uniref:sensor histidine kinase n=1 Tax=uncultured Roseibium sp. TaxID=1936171 RepID=UPI0026193A40|nr:histidine kinase dimerization/phosphoacceptor domain -containing protein [uncultured Roseibium sp.]